MNTSVAFIFAFFSCAGLFGRDIYVSTLGNDRNPGTAEQPVASLYGAMERVRELRAGGNSREEVRIIVAEGTYFMDRPLILTDADSGTEGMPLVFTAAKDARPVFIGGIPVAGWEKVADQLWKTNVREVTRYGFYFEQFYVNGRRAIRAKSPNQGFYFLKAVRETVVDPGKGRVAAVAVQQLKVFTDAAREFSTFSESDFDDALITFYHKWDNTRKRVTAYNADSSIVYTAGNGMKPWNLLDTQTQFTIENYKAALDTAREWYLERNGDLYYRPAPGEDPANAKAYAPVTDRFIVLRGGPRKIEHIRFENLRFQVSGYRTPPSGNEPAQAAAPLEAVIMADFAHKIEVVNCEISQTGTNAIWFREACTDCTVTRCYMYDLGGGGVKIGTLTIPGDEVNLTRRIKVDNNIIRSGGHVFPCAVGVAIFQSGDNAVTHNEIADLRYSGISVGWVWGYKHSPSKRNTIEYNHIHHLGWGDLSDMGGVYCLGPSEGTRVRHNVIHHIYSFDYGGWGLYTDEGSTGILMENNLVYACKNSGFHQHYGRQNIIRNNIFAANIKAQLQATRIEEHESFSFTRNIIWFDTGELLSSRWSKITFRSDSNCYWDARNREVTFSGQSFREWQQTLKDRHSIVADPRFADPRAFNFRITNKTVLRKTGFRPFDPTKAGVYGSPEWTGLAKLDPAVIAAYDRRVIFLLSRSEK